MKDIIGYIRVSTDKQGKSGLSLAVQQDVIAAHAATSNLAHVYVEVETGKRCDRPELAAALEHAKRLNATLVIAKLDRLARNAAFIANLLEAGVEIFACDLPFANRMILQIMAAVAEYEGKNISDRIRVALAKAKERGVLLGGSNPKGHQARCDALARGRATRWAKTPQQVQWNANYAAKGYSK